MDEVDRFALARYADAAARMLDRRTTTYDFSTVFAGAEHARHRATSARSTWT